MSYQSNWQLSWDTTGQKVYPFSESRHSSRLASHRWPEGRINYDNIHSIGTSKSLKTILIVACTITVSRIPYGSLFQNCIPEQRPFIVIDPARLMLLVIMLFGEALEMIFLLEIVCRFHATVDRRCPTGFANIFCDRFVRQRYMNACRSKKWCDQLPSCIAGLVLSSLVIV